MATARASFQIQPITLSEIPTLGNLAVVSGHDHNHDPVARQICAADLATQHGLQLQPISQHGYGQTISVQLTPYLPSHTLRRKNSDHLMDTPGRRPSQAQFGRRTSWSFGPPPRFKLVDPIASFSNGTMQPSAHFIFISRIYLPKGFFFHS